MSKGNTLSGSCFCGEVQFEVKASPWRWVTAIADRAGIGRRGR